MKVWYEDFKECGSHSRDWQIIQNSIPDFELAERMQDADIAIVYLCGLSKKAIDEIENELEKVKFALSRNPKLKVFIGGCAAELISVQALLHKYNLTDVFAKDTMAEVVLGGLGLEPSEKTATVISHDTVVVSIATGCRRHCAFCKTWYLDMTYHSVLKSVILKEIGEAVSRGVFHICLTAENSTEYGSDLEKDGKGHLGELLYEIFQTYPDIKIMDVMGVCLDEVDDKLAKYLCEEKRIDTIQMEVQSFIPAVREEMLLKKSAEEAKAIYAKLRSCKTVKSNIITDHPGETLANFRAQLDYILANEEVCWSLDVSPLDNTIGTHTSELEQVKPEVYEETRDLMIKAIGKMREKWVRRLLESGKPLFAYAASYDPKTKRTLCIVWGQPVLIKVKRRLPLYENCLVYPTECTGLFGDRVIMNGDLVAS